MASRHEDSARRSDKLRKLHVRAAPSSPERLAALVHTELERYARVIREAGIRAE